MSSRRLLIGCLAALLWLAVPAHAQRVPSPDEFFGFPMGAEQKLASWDRIAGYFQAVDRGSDRVIVQEVGKTSMGKPYLLAIVSSADTLRDLTKYQDMQRKLADPRRTSADEAGRIARDGKAVLLIGMNVHASEIGGSQMANALLYKMASENSPWVQHVLDNVILLIIPSENPDGQQMVVDWYDKTVGTPYEGSPTPDLYHKYVGHDNNRDAYMLTQVETQHLARITYKDWLPEVYLDVHQTGNARARIFVPPYKNPPNPNVDPLLWSETNLLGQAMAGRLQEDGKTGVIWGEQYTGFWQGANSTNPWWHNMVALLTETASSRMGSTVLQERADPSRPSSGGEAARSAPASPGGPGGSAPLRAPADTQYRMNYLQPWLGGTWSLADVVDYQLTSTLGLLDATAHNKEMLKRNFYLMNARTIARFKQGSPYAWVVPPAQRDPVAVARLLQIVQAQGGEVHRADAPFTADGQPYPAGTHVLLLAQPAGRWIKDLLEAQKYPDIRWPDPTAPIDRPYDVAAWSLGMLMGVETTRVDKPFEAALSPVSGNVEAPAGAVSGTGPVFIIRHETVASIAATNRLLMAGASVSWTRDDWVVNGRTLPPGIIVVKGAKPETLDRIARELKVAIDAAPVPATVQLMPLRAPRVAVYDPWGGSTDAGWTRWLFEQHELPFTHARPPDLRMPNLLDRFDVIVLADMSPPQMLGGNQDPSIPPAYRGGIGDEGLRHLQAFLSGGGTVVTLGNAAQFAIEHLGAPVEDLLKNLGQDAFFCPGSILQIEVDTRHPVGFGMPARAHAMFIGNGGYAPTVALSSATATTIARYPQSPLLQSGWIMGEERLRGTAAVVEAASGKGRILMLTFRVQSRAQSWNTFHLLFNSVFYGAAMAPGMPVAPARNNPR